LILWFLQGSTQPHFSKKKTKTSDEIQPIKKLANKHAKMPI
jgi:hypothetical protein